MQKNNKNSSVALIKTKANYPSTTKPTKKYKEFKNLNLHDECDGSNHVYEAVRESFKLLELDKNNLNTSEWNPLSDLINKGDTVLLKPNFVSHSSKRKETTLDELITHPSIIFAVLDYAILALKGEGKVIIGDAPIQEANFVEIVRKLGLAKKIKYYNEKTSIKIELLDFRKERSINNKYRKIQRISLQGDPRGYSIINLNEKSEFKDITNQSSLFRVTNYDKEKMIIFHNNNQHSYIIANSVLAADVVISLPKIKSHRKAGITCALKNLIGINGSKDCLPHHRKGSVEEGGDEYKYKSIRKRFYSLILERRARSNSSFLCFLLYLLKSTIIISEKIIPYKDEYKEGSWYGNRTIPRTLVDINYILLFADKNSNIGNNPKRKLLSITDVIIGGDGDGPLCPSRKEMGYILASRDFIANDIVASYLVGFDPYKIPTFEISLQSKININKIRQMESIEISSNIPKLVDIKSLCNLERIHYEPTSGWQEHIELD